MERAISEIARPHDPGSQELLILAPPQSRLRWFIIFDQTAGGV